MPPWIVFFNHRAHMPWYYEEILLLIKITMGLIGLIFLDRKIIGMLERCQITCEFLLLGCSNTMRGLPVKPRIRLFIGLCYLEKHFLISCSTYKTNWPHYHMCLKHWGQSGNCRHCADDDFEWNCVVKHCCNSTEFCPYSFNDNKSGLVQVMACAYHKLLTAPLWTKSHLA